MGVLTLPASLGTAFTGGGLGISGGADGRILMCLEDDLLVKILRELSPEDLRNVFPVSKRLFACAVEAKGWTYLPFDSMTPHAWERFWEEVWLKIYYTRILH